MLLEVSGYVFSRIPGLFGGLEKGSFFLGLGIFDENFLQPSINLYNLYALSKPGFPSLLSKYYNKILWEMSRQIIEIVSNLPDLYPEYSPGGKDVK